ncbi:MAG: serine kinase [Pseudorhodoplanes sp.]|nr:serine kinase [Pseudorhodoplanes sp.]
MTGSTIHASAVLIGARAMLIRGPAGSGKSRLVLGLLDAGVAGLLPLARLVTDDRACVEAVNGQLLVRPPEQLKGLIEVRGVGIRRLPFEPLAVVGWVVDLAALDADRLPQPEAETATIAGVPLARLAVAAGIEPLPLVLAALRTN